jgi:hypothetical protein
MRENGLPDGLDRPGASTTVPGGKTPGAEPAMTRPSRSFP